MKNEQAMPAISFPIIGHPTQSLRAVFRMATRITTSFFIGIPLGPKAHISCVRIFRICYRCGHILFIYLMVASHFPVGSRIVRIIRQSVGLNAIISAYVPK